MKRQENHHAKLHTHQHTHQHTKHEISLRHRLLRLIFDSPIRRLLHDPKRLLRDYVREGDKVLEIGPGKGYFTATLTKLVGQTGTVLAIDINHKTLETVETQVKKHGNPERLNTATCANERLGLSESFQFVLVFWMYHEVLNKAEFMRDISANIMANGSLLIAEPDFRVTEREFDESIAIAINAGFKIATRPSITSSRSVYLTKSTTVA